MSRSPDLPPSERPGPLPVRDPAKARAAVGRYRVMAWVTGTVLLIFTLEIVLKYGFDVLGYDWFGVFHGAVYMVYLVAVLDLWSKMRWGFGRLVTMVLGGVVPVMSFVVERRVHADADARLGSASSAGRA